MNERERQKMKGATERDEGREIKFWEKEKSRKCDALFFFLYRRRAMLTSSTSVTLIMTCRFARHEDTSCFVEKLQKTSES